MPWVHRREQSFLSKKLFSSRRPKAVKCLKIIAPHWAWQSEYPLYGSYRPGHKKGSAHQQAPQAAFDVLSLMQQQDPGWAEWVCTPVWVRSIMTEWQALRVLFTVPSTARVQKSIQQIRQKACPSHPQVSYLQFWSLHHHHHLTPPSLTNKILLKSVVRSWEVSLSWARLKSTDSKL